ncbi:MAG: 1-(5-phosphoribosyl)-5-[(5-phosphoribosylamino)methylideneamino]imidazole-4-carboxamide isomerase [bacterium]
MLIIPAIDIKNGKCVRLYQGREDRETVYGDDPAAMAVRWQRGGAGYLHVVDLDGAFKGAPQNLESIKELLERVTVPVELGGGLRDIETVRRVFKMGVDRVILGTAAIRDRDFLKAAVKEFGRQVFVGLDMKEGVLAVEGWTKTAGMRAGQILPELEAIGVGGVVFTDVLTDGTLSGPNFDSLEAILELCSLDIIASGGVSSVEHLRRLKSLHNGRIYGVIIGKALYSGDLELHDALAAVSEASEVGGNAPPC